MSHVRHTLDIYGVHLRLAWDAKTYASMRRENPALDPLRKARKSVGLTTDSREAQTGHQFIWIWINMPSFTHEGDLWNTAAHEAFHVVEGILVEMGIPLQGEPAAYLTGWVANWIWASIPREDKKWAV